MPTLDGHPSGVLIRNGVLEHPPAADRTSVGIASDGTLHPDRVSLLGYWRGVGSRVRLGLNDPPSENGYSLFTHAYGATTPSAKGAAEVILHPFPNATANTDLIGVVADVISPSSGKTAIPADGAVLQARGSGAFKLVGDAQLGTSLTIRYTLNPTWDGIVGAIGGGPVIVKDGKLIFQANEGFSSAQLSPHDPRTAVGQRADGKIIMVAVDGRQPGYSAGVTNYELALAMMQLGAVSASALDAGEPRRAEEGHGADRLRAAWARHVQVQLGRAGAGRKLEVLCHRDRRSRADVDGGAQVRAQQHARGARRAAEGVEAAQEGHAAARVVHSRPSGEGHRHGRDRERQRRPRPLAQLRRCRCPTAPVERAEQLRPHRVRRVVQVARLGDEQARARRPVRAVHCTPVVSRRCSLRASRAR